MAPPVLPSLGPGLKILLGAATLYWVIGLNRNDMVKAKFSTFIQVIFRMMF